MVRTVLSHVGCLQVAHTCPQRERHMLGNLEGKANVEPKPKLQFVSSENWTKLVFLPSVVQISLIQPGITSPSQISGIQLSVQRHTYNRYFLLLGLFLL